MLTFFRDLFSPPRHVILLVIAAWIGLNFAEKRAERHGISKDGINSLIFYGLIAFILGGRISFVLQNISAFTKSPLNILSINPDLFDMFGALAAAAIASLVFLQRNQIPFWSAMDALTPFFAVLGIGLGFSHLAAGTAFGLPTHLPWAVDLWNAKRHPTQIYEILASALIFILLWLKKHDPRPGMLFLTYAALTAGFLVFLSAFRADQTLILNGIRQEQVVALGALAASFILIELRLRQIKNKIQE
jgi:phosphatidylglycerol:prolipoprotein diacylglycerol transferase